jgi:16S rRNA (guanine527-N7)-methyltransferase
MNQQLFAKLLDLLLKWNKTYNLTAITDPNEVWSKHFDDSLSVMPYLPQRGTLLDLGSGAGFPGIPIKIEMPNLEVTLVEATRKKCNFIEEVMRQLGLQGIRVYNARAEDKKLQEKIGKVDVVISRATWKIVEYLKIADAYVKDDGLVIAMKGPEFGTVLKDIKKNAPFKLEDSRQYTLEHESSTRTLLFFRKI